MKRDETIHSKKHGAFALVITIFLLSSNHGYAQLSKEISVSIYPGFTFVNFEQALGYSDDYMEDWSEFHYSAALRGFLLSEKSIQPGAEVAWQQLYYAYYIVPYGASPVYREFNISTVSLTVLGRYTMNNIFLVGGAGIHFFNDGIAPAICIEAGYNINAGANLKLPVSFRVNPIFGSGTPIPFSAGIGVSYTIR